MDRSFHRLIILFLIIAISLSLSIIVKGEGLFPETNQLFGTAMPSIGQAINRACNETIATNEGIKEIYYGFGSVDYLTFGQYLAGSNASLQEYSINEKDFHAVISVRGEVMSFIYNWVEQTAIAIYPLGTRAEKTRAEVEKANSIFPLVGEVLPSARYAIDRDPDEVLFEGNEMPAMSCWDTYLRGLYGDYMQLPPENKRRVHMVQATLD